VDTMVPPHLSRASQSRLPPLVPARESRSHTQVGVQVQFK
jgi:hypothetical protein